MYRWKLRKLSEFFVLLLHQQFTSLMKIFQIEHTLCILEVQNVFDLVGDFPAAWLKHLVFETLAEWPNNFQNVVRQVVVEVIWLPPIAININISIKLVKLFLIRIHQPSYLWLYTKLIVLISRRILCILNNRLFLTTRLRNWWGCIYIIISTCTRFGDRMYFYLVNCRLSLFLILVDWNGKIAAGIGLLE